MLPAVAPIKLSLLTLNSLIVVTQSKIEQDKGNSKGEGRCKPIQITLL